MNQISLKKAFSLIELAIAILIIGILIAGIVKGGDVYNKVKLCRQISYKLFPR